MNNMNIPMVRQLIPTTLPQKSKPKKEKVKDEFHYIQTTKTCCICKKELYWKKKSLVDAGELVCMKHGVAGNLSISVLPHVATYPNFPYEDWNDWYNRGAYY